MSARRAIALAAALLVASMANGGHESPVYPSYYPHEIEIRTIAPGKAAELLRAGDLHAHVGPIPAPDPSKSIGAVESLGSLVVVRLDPDSPLAETAEVTIPLLARPERSVAATKSFIASLLVLLRLVAAWTGEKDLDDACTDAPAVLRQAWSLDWSPAVDALCKARTMFVVGRGLNLAIAQEAALKLKETSGLHAEAYSAAEVKHGPTALVGPGFPVLVLEPGDEGRADVEALARDYVGRGASVVMTGGELPGAVNLPFVPGLHPALAPIATIQAFYRFAAALSVARGFDPDHPPHLRKVTRTR